MPTRSRGSTDGNVGSKELKTGIASAAALALVIVIVIVVVIVIAVAAPAAAAPAAGPPVAVPPVAVPSDCDNFFGQRCVVDLATGVHMSYFDLGSAAGETLIMLHTDTTSAVEWAWTANALLSLNPALHVYALDQRGAGLTDLPNTARC